MAGLFIMVVIHGVPGVDFFYFYYKDCRVLTGIRDSCGELLTCRASGTFQMSDRRVELAYLGIIPPFRRGKPGWVSSFIIIAKIYY